MKKTVITTTEVKDWATHFLAKAETELSKDEIKEQRKFASLVLKPENKILLCKMLDESSQIRDRRKMAERIKFLLKQYGIPDFFSKFDQFLMRLYNWIGYAFDFISIPIFKKKLRLETNKIIIAEERPRLTRHLGKRWDEQIGQNVNLLGEVVLGDIEANNRYEHYMEALTAPDINYISIKLSGIYAQIRSLAYEQNREELKELVANIFQQAIDNPYKDWDGTMKPKFVNLDMEEYKDTDITLDVFLEVLAMPQFKDYTAGIVIQAYLPDAKELYLELVEFAKKRCADGGAPLKVRLVKGANLHAETVISSLRGWENPVYATKVEVDANFMHILDLALKPENAAVLHVGVASHNFFSLGYAALLSEQNGVEKFVTFEMLEGMANHLPRVMKRLKKHIILYTPVVKKEHFLNAVSYLVRRLDENTEEDNFLRHSFNLTLDSDAWHFLYNQFEEAYAMKDTIYTSPRREQDRTKRQQSVTDITTFKNEPDTDLYRKQNRDWGIATLKRWEDDVRDSDYKIPVQIGDKELETEHKRKYYDRSRNDEVSFCEVNMSTHEQVKEIVKVADADKSGWRTKSVKERAEILFKVADNLAAKRGELLGAMAAITGKSITEGDVEASEAIDFCRYYAVTMQEVDKLESVKQTPKGSVLVIPPWNFPLAIPVGGVAAGLMTGNTVILKPATVAMPIAWEFAQCFWDAGVPKDTLQVVCCAERSSLDYLTGHPTIKHIIFTGGTETAFKLLENSPRTPLSAETGGKNSIIITSSGDLDHAIMSAVTSAFGNAGQKCSACSLLLVERKLYNNPLFKEKLRDATISMRTGSVWDPINLVGPMITSQNDKLLYAIENLEAGEEWLVAPEWLDEKEYILKPTVKWGVKPGSYTFKTELFAPLLAVVCIDDLEQGIEYVNSSEYGLTSGVQTLDEREKRRWIDKIEAGNLYINRGITGAIVNRQPFGGMKLSAFGGGIKAGGPNYVTSFVNFEESGISGKTDSKATFVELLDNEKDRGRLNYAAQSFQKAYDTIFSVVKDNHRLFGEENVLRYLPLKSCGFRVLESDSLVDTLLVIKGATMMNTPLTISIAESDPKIESLKSVSDKVKGVTLRVEDESAFIESMEQYERIRACSTNLSDEVYAKAAKIGKHIASSKPLYEGRLELLHYLKEQSIAHEYHRYGSIFDQDDKLFG